MYLHYDYESRSECDLEVHGLDRYIKDPTTEVLLCAFAFDEGKIQLWEPHLEPMPADLRDALQDPWVTKCGWNVSFERGIGKYVLGIDTPISEFVDVMVRARYVSMPGSLEDVGRILKLKQNEAKLARGKELIKLFCEPARQGGGRTLFGTERTLWRDWNTNPAEWEEFKDYCKRDVEAERTIFKKLSPFPLPALEQQGWLLDQEVNERGFPTDMPLVVGAAKVAETAKEYLRGEMKELTGVENPNSNPQILAWAQTQGYGFSGLGKAFVARALGGECELTEVCKRVLTIRKQAAKTSDSKFEAIRDRVSDDGFLRYMFNFLGAARTGRWTGKDVQTQNLPRPTKAVEKALEIALQLLRDADYEGTKAKFGDVMDVVTSCIRSAFRAPSGHHFAVSDLNAIENRSLGFLAQCDKILKVFRENRCPYLDFATEMYPVTYAEIAAAYEKGDPIAKERRQNAKPGVLGCFGKHTPVLTRRGWVPITQVDRRDEVFDGVEWVNHGGVVFQGCRRTLDMYGVAVTADHEILTYEGWKTAWDVSRDSLLGNRAIDLATGLLSEANLWAGPDSTMSASALVAGCPLNKSSRIKSGAEEVFDILNAGPRNRFVVLTDAGPLVVHNCGYRLGGGEEVETEDGDIVRTGLWGYAQNLGIELSRETAHESVRVFREKYPEVVQTWYDYENAAFHAYRTGEPVEVGPIVFECHGKKIMLIRLPSGRCLHYIRPKIEKREFFGKLKDTLTYEGISIDTKQWDRLSTHGGKLLENVDQAMSRDLLLHGMLLADKEGLDIVAHCHDEIIVLAPNERKDSLKVLEQCMSVTPDWAKGLPLRAEGFTSEVYRKG